MEGGEEVVDVAVEGGNAEGVGAVLEEEDVDEGAVLGRGLLDFWLEKGGGWTYYVYNWPEPG